MAAEFRLNGNTVVYDGEDVARILVPEYRARDIFNFIYTMEDMQEAETEQWELGHDAGHKEGWNAAISEFAAKIISQIESSYDAIEETVKTKSAKAAVEKLYVEIMAIIDSEKNKPST